MKIRAGLLMIGFICEAATEKIAERIAKHYGDDAEIRPMLKSEWHYINIKDVERL